MASRKSAAVNSSHLAESFDCALTEQAATRNTNAKQIVISFIGTLLNRRILAPFQVLEPALFGLNSEAEDDDDLHNQETDHETKDTADAVISEQCNNQVRRKNDRTTAKGIADSACAHAHVGGKQFQDVNGKEKRYLHVDTNHQQEACYDKEDRVFAERVDKA